MESFLIQKLNFLKTHTCKYCGETKHYSLFRTKSVCKDCRYEYQKKRIINKSNHRRWGEYLDKCKLSKTKNYICRRCGKTKLGIEFISKLICKECSYKSHRKYLEKVGTPMGKYWQIKHSAKRRGIFLKMEISDFVNWWNNQDRKCLYCERTEEEIKNSIDILDSRTHKLSIDRLDSFKGYTLDNIALACPRCNSIKGKFFTKNEMLEIGKIIKRKLNVQKEFNNIISNI